MSAPSASASTIGAAPRYALAVTSRSRTSLIAAPVSRLRNSGDDESAAAARTSSRTSSPVTTPIRNERQPASSSAARQASAQPRGFRPPAFAISRHRPPDDQYGASDRTTSTKSRANPASGSRSRCIARIDIDTSAR